MGHYAHTRAHRHTRTLPNTAALGPEIEEGAVNRTTHPTLAFPRPGIELVRIRRLNLPYHTKVNKSIPSSSVDTQIPLEVKVALATHGLVAGNTHIHYTKSRFTPIIHIYILVQIYIRRYFRAKKYIKAFPTPIIHFYILVQSYIQCYLRYIPSPEQEEKLSRHS